MNHNLIPPKTSVDQAVADLTSETERYLGRAVPLRERLHLFGRAVIEEIANYGATMYGFGKPIHPSKQPSDTKGQ